MRRHEPVEVIESLIRGCLSISGFYLNGTEPITRNIPAIFVAAERMYLGSYSGNATLPLTPKAPPTNSDAIVNRVDVIKVLLAEGSHQDLRYPVRPGCQENGHYDCSSKDNTCRNALCVAREYKSKDAEAFLLEEGIEDRCDAHCSHWYST